MKAGKKVLVPALVVFIVLMFILGIIVGMKISPREGQTIQFWELKEFESCGKYNKVTIYAFHSPTSMISAYQRDILDQVKKEFGDAVDIKYVCSPLEVHLEDVDTCLSFTNQYPKKWNLNFTQSQQLIWQYTSVLPKLSNGEESFVVENQTNIVSLRITPILVVNCNKIRIGSLALGEKFGETSQSVEKSQIEKEVCNLLEKKPFFCNFLTISF